MSQFTALPDRASAWSEQLRTAGRRVTKQRLAVLAAIDTHPHSTADNILDLARRELPGQIEDVVRAVRLRGPR